MIKKITANYHSKIIYENGNVDSQDEIYPGVLISSESNKRIVLDTNQESIEFIIYPDSITVNYTQPYKNTMLFKLNEKNTVVYKTEVGEFNLLIVTNKLEITSNEFVINYSLYLNHTKTGDYILNVTYKSTDN